MAIKNLIPARFRSRAKASDGEGENWRFILLSVALALMLAHALLESIGHSGKIDVQAIGLALLKELSVAAFIGWVISVGVDRAAHRKEAHDAEAKRQAIAENVIAGVFGVQYPTPYVRTVIAAMLRPTVIRESYKANYTIRDLSPAEVAHLGVTPGRFVAFITRRSFRLTNVSSADILHPVTSTIPVRRAPLLRSFARMRGVAFGGKPISDDDVAKGLVPDSEMDEHACYRWDRTIAAGASLDVSLDSIMIKEYSDNEVWASALPTTDGVDFTVQVIPGMRFGLEAISSSPLRKELTSEADGTGSWKIAGPILPNESVLFWWRSKEDDGEVTTAALLDTPAVKSADIASDVKPPKPRRRFRMPDLKFFGDGGSKD